MAMNEQLGFMWVSPRSRLLSFVVTLFGQRCSRSVDGLLD